MSAQRHADDCGCCTGLGPQTPVEVENAPGLPAIGYRVGTHSRFKSSMLAALSSARRPPLGALNTREDDDFSIALVDAWASVCDVLTFYQERAANEAFLRTASERQSVLELARLIGYELRPGVSATAYLAFQLETAAGAPLQTVVPAGTQVQSVPGADEKPQIYETSAETLMRPEWNALRPRLLQPQRVGRKSRAVTVQGIGLAIAPGDLVMLVTGSKKRDLRTVFAVVEDELSGTTLLQVAAVPAKPQEYRPAPSGDAGVVDSSPLELTAAAVQTEVVEHTWASADLAAAAAAKAWPEEELTRIVSERLAQVPAPTGVALHRFRERAAIFGHNAPLWDSLPETLRSVTVDSPVPPFPGSWEGRKLADESAFRAAPIIDLDAPHPTWTAGGWIALTSPALRKTFAIVGTAELSLAKFTVNGKATRLTVDRDKGFHTYTVRGTTVHGDSRELALAAVPIPDPVAGSRIELDGFHLGLDTGRLALVTGEPVEQPGVVATEAVTFDAVTIEGGRTVLQLTRDLDRSYVRSTVTINANVALATHGESKVEVLGSGDATQPYQQFDLRQPPLTYVAAPTPSGADTTLRVYVDGVAWHEVPSLYATAPNDRVYITRNRDDGGTTVEFGDGRGGARLPTGQENVEARYRKGIGLGGLVRAGQLSLPLTRPLGVRTVSNPLPSEGADDPEPRDAARANAPLTVLTLDRVVSLDDYESFSRAFAGVAKALATRISEPGTTFVLLTIAGPVGTVIDPDGVVAANLKAAIVGFGDVAVRFRIAAYRPVPFQLAAKIKVDPDRIADDVLAAVDATLKERLSFDARSFGQPVSQSEVEAVIQGVEGVVAVDLDKLFRTDTPAPELSPRLFATVPSSGDSELGAELLTLDQRRLDLTVMP